MQPLLTVIVTWLSLNLGLPATQELPRVELVPQSKIVALRYRGMVADSAPRIAVAGNPDTPLVLGQNIVAVYDDTRRTIYLHEGWTGTTPAEVSVLVHEMVHHLQNHAGLKYECPAAREKLAYEAQNQWLKLFGRDLEQDFEIDMLSLLVKSTCMH